MLEIPPSAKPLVGLNLAGLSYLFISEMPKGEKDMRFKLSVHIIEVSSGLSIPWERTQP